MNGLGSLAPPVVVGLLPAIGAWGALMAKNGRRAAGVGAPGGPGFSAALVPAFLQGDIWIEGAFALEQGFSFASMILAAATVAIARFTLPGSARRPTPTCGYGNDTSPRSWPHVSVSLLGVSSPLRLDPGARTAIPVTATARGPLGGSSALSRTMTSSTERGGARPALHQVWSAGPAARFFNSL